MSNESSDNFTIDKLPLFGDDSDYFEDLVGNTVYVSRIISHDFLEIVQENHNNIKFPLNIKFDIRCRIFPTLADSGEINFSGLYDLRISPNTYTDIFFKLSMRLMQYIAVEIKSGIQKCEFDKYNYYRFKFGAKVILDDNRELHCRFNYD